jgi:PDZ domain
MRSVWSGDWSSLLSAAFALVVATISQAGEIRIPSDRLEDLGSPEFRIREHAEAELLAWGRKHPETAKSGFLWLSRNAVDPEVRERCLDVLRSLVTDEYLKEGEGYIGIALAQKDDVVTVPGDPKVRNAVRVIEVRADTPGERSGILLNDLIVSLEGEDWHEIEATPLFREKIKKMMPTSVANLTVLRAGELIDLKVTLGRRPLMADMFFNGQSANLDITERAAKEAYFQRWLSERKTAK